MLAQFADEAVQLVEAGVIDDQSAGAALARFDAYRGAQLFRQLFLQPDKVAVGFCSFCVSRFFPLLGKLFGLPHRQPFVRHQVRQLDLLHRAQTQ